MDNPSEEKLLEIERRFGEFERWNGCQPSESQRTQLKRVISRIVSLVNALELLSSQIEPSLDAALNSAFKIEDPGLSWVPHAFIKVNKEQKAQASPSNTSKVVADSDQMAPDSTFGRAHFVLMLEAAKRALALLYLDTGWKGQRLEKQSTLVGLLLEAYEDESGKSATRSVNGAFYRYCLNGLEVLALRLSMPELHDLDGIEDRIRREVEFGKPTRSDRTET